MSALARSTVQYQVYEYSFSMEEWLWIIEPTENELEARQVLEEARQIYPNSKFRLVKIENTVTILEGPKK